MLVVLLCRSICIFRSVLKLSAVDLIVNLIKIRLSRSSVSNKCASLVVIIDNFPALDLNQDVFMSFIKFCHILIVVITYKGVSYDPSYIILGPSTGIY